MSINLNFGLWHSGAKLSYLRYLTFKSLRHFHPNSKIDLFIGSKFNNTGYNWNIERQDFERNDMQEDYVDKLVDLDVNIVKVDFFGQYPSNYQSDFFRYWYLNTYGGFYLDTDQIILKSFEGLPLDHDFIYSGYKAMSCGYYTPVGVLGAAKTSEIVRDMMAALPKLVNINNYNSAGPFALRHLLLNNPNKYTEKIYNAPSSYFYPIPESFGVHRIYSGEFSLTSDSFAAHWYGGNSISQEFNSKYNEDMAKNNNDTISRFLRGEKII